MDKDTKKILWIIGIIIVAVVLIGYVHNGTFAVANKNICTSSEPGNMSDFVVPLSTIQNYPCQFESGLNVFGNPISNPEVVCGNSMNESIAMTTQLNDGTAISCNNFIANLTSFASTMQGTEGVYYHPFVYDGQTILKQVRTGPRVNNINETSFIFCTNDGKYGVAITEDDNRILLDRYFDTFYTCSVYQNNTYINNFNQTINQTIQNPYSPPFINFDFNTVLIILVAIVLIIIIYRRKK